MIRTAIHKVTNYHNTLQLSCIDNIEYVFLIEKEIEVHHCKLALNFFYIRVNMWGQLAHATTNVIVSN